MNLIQITPGAGGMFCGNCFRDNALVRVLRGMGHSALMVPLYLPIRLDEPDQSAGTPIFFGGITVYLEQKSALFRSAPAWLRDLLASPTLLRWAAGKAAKTRATDVGDLTVSMLRGEEGNQARALEELIVWLKLQPAPDVIFLSNALLVGMARRFKQDLRAPVVCTLQGEDYFLDSLPPTHREEAWQILGERAADIDLFIAPSRYFAELMTRRLRLPPQRVRVVHNGINLDGYGVEDRESRVGSQKSGSPSPLAIGYFARMCREKGLETLVDGFIELKRRGQVNDLKLRVGGSCGPSDEPFVQSMRDRLRDEGLLGDVTFHPNLDRPAKLEFLRSLTAFSVPAIYGEAFGMYLIEALAAGVPVVQPRTASFTELIEATGGGVLCEPGKSKALADALESLLLDPDGARKLGERGRQAVFEKFSADHMASETVRLCEELVRRAPSAALA